MNRILLLLCVLLFSIGENTVSAQTSTVIGEVTSADGTPIEFVNVSLEGTTLGTTTNKNGKYQIDNVSAGKYRLVISLIGYEPQKNKIELVAHQIKTIPSVVLVTRQETLSEVVVRDKKNRYTNNSSSSTLRLNTEISKLPQNIQVINSDLLRDQQVTSMMDGVAQNVSGATMIEHWGHFARINMRGFRLPAFRNGVNFLDSWGPLSEDMNTVERIEFVKGPSGFMMTAGEPGGFYNVVTKKPTEEFVGNVSLTAGSFDFFRGTVDVGGKLTNNGKLLYCFNGMYQTSDSHRGDEDAQRFGIAPTLTYKFSDRTQITSELNMQQAESYIGAAYVFAPVADGYGSLDRDFKSVDTNYPVSDIQELTSFTNFKHDFSDNWGIASQFSYLRYQQDGNSFWSWAVTDTGDADRRITQWDALSLGKYFQTYLYGKFKTGSISHNLLGGFDYTDKEYYADFYNTVMMDAGAPFNIYEPVYGNTIAPDFDRSVDVRDRNEGVPYSGFNVNSVYLQDEIGFWEDKIRLTLAGRFTNIVSDGKEEKDNKFTPRVGISADVMPTLSIYALYDQSFLPQAGISFDGESFDPVDARDIEGGIKKSFFDGRLRTTLSVYRITKENILVSDPEHPDFSIQLGEVQSQGFEFDLQGEITTGLNLILNYANTDVEITDDPNPDVIGIKVAGHSQHVTNGWLTYSFSPNSSLKGFGASAGYQFQAGRSTWAWGAENQTDLPDYFKLNGGLFWANDKLRVQFNINNILNEYLYSGANYGSYLYWQSEPGINGRITVSYKFS